MHFEILPVYRDTVNHFVCANNLPYAWQGQDLSESGFYSDTLTSFYGCDSILTLNLNVLPSFNVYDTVTVYKVDLPYEFGTQWLTGSGTYIELFNTVNGCDSVVTLTLLIDSTDNRPPDIFCQNTTLTLDENGLASLNIEDAYSYAYDASGIKSITSDKIDFTCSDIGEQKVRIKATDNNDNSLSCTSTVTIVDELPPVISSVGKITVTTEGDDCSMTVDYPEIIADDNCGTESLYLIEGLGPDGRFPVGVTTEIWVAEDASGNRDTMSFTVTVEEVVSDPGFDAVEDLEIPEDAGWITLDIENITDGSPCTDYQTSLSFNIFDNELIADYQIEYTSGDNSGDIKILPAQNAFGESQAVIKLTNEGTGKEYSDTMNIHITPVNDPPFFLEPFGDIEMNPGDTLRIELSPEYNTIFGDVDDDLLQLAVKQQNGENVPDWLLFRNDSLFAYPSVADSGCTELVIEITDSHGETASSQFDICVSPYVGIDDPLSREIRVYPNPTSGKVFIDLSGFSGVLKDLAVVNIAGQEIIHRRISGEMRQEVDLSRFTSGIYILKIIGEDVDMNFRIILKAE